jgi:hypothetical protein
MAKAFHQLVAKTQEARVRAALAAGTKPEAGEVTVFLEQPEEELTAVAEVLERVTTRPAHGNPSKPYKPAGGRRGVTVKRVRPTEPDYSKLPEGKREAAKDRYEAALAEWKESNTAEVRAAEKKAPAKRTPKAPKATASNGHASRTSVVVDDLPAGWDWKAKALPGRVLKLKAQGKTIKEITAELGLPAREGVWHRVSLVYRAAADAKGIERPRRKTAAK